LVLASGIIFWQILVAGPTARQGNALQLSHRSWISLDWHLAGLLTHASSNLNSLPE
jgi:hypothetical protein